MYELSKIFLLEKINKFNQNCNIYIYIYNGRDG